MSVGWNVAMTTTPDAPSDPAAAGPGQPGDDASRLASREQAENFPVALRMLPDRYRRDLHAVYAFARTVDDIGDRPGCSPQARTAELTEFRADLHDIWRTGRPKRPVLRRLVPTVRARGLDLESFDLLVQANLTDQRVTRYATFEQLRDYCRCSADPVGRLVLAIFGRHGAALERDSDRVCTALQLVEHWQDVGEDRRAGRVYLPQEDLAAFGVDEQDLDADTASPAVQALMRFETERAAALLDLGAPIVGRLTGWARVAVAGYVAGGRAAVAALRRCGGDVLRATPQPRRVDVAAAAARLLVPGAGGSA